MIPFARKKEKPNQTKPNQSQTSRAFAALPRLRPGRVHGVRDEVQRPPVLRHLHLPPRRLGDPPGCGGPPSHPQVGPHITGPPSWPSSTWPRPRLTVGCLKLYDIC